MYIQKRTSSGPITVATVRRRKSASVNSKIFVSGVYPIKMKVLIPSPTCDDVTTYVCNINTSYSHCHGKQIQVKMDDCGSKTVDILPDEEDEKDVQCSGSSPVSTSRPQSDDLPAETNPSGVPVYVVIIGCVTSVLLTAALYTAVVVGWTKCKCQTQTLTLANTDTEGNYETTTRDVNVEENAYCSLTPVQTAYVNININNQPTSSTSAASPASPSSNTNMYYSVVEDSAV
ncbi:uncharacterized protein LOC124259555 isoform X2 [Haliotis rubra]|nr:uncharacterized protein LOC124259555 isoform X2 [Haliotis rubra]